GDRPRNRQEVAGRGASGQRGSAEDVRHIDQRRTPVRAQKLLLVFLLGGPKKRHARLHGKTPGQVFRKVIISPCCHSEGAQRPWESRCRRPQLEAEIPRSLAMTGMGWE